MSNNKHGIALRVRRALARVRERGVAGFSLTEMLATMLILVMVTTMVATGIPAAQDAYLKTVNASNAQSALSTTLAALRNELGMASEVHVKGNEVYYLSGDSYWASIANNSGDTDNKSSLEKKYYTGTTYGVDGNGLELDKTGGKEGAGGLTGLYDLVPDKSITNGLRVEFSDPAFDESKNVVTIGKVVVKDKLNQELAQTSNYQIRTRG